MHCLVQSVLLSPRSRKNGSFTQIQLMVKHFNNVLVSMTLLAQTFTDTRHHLHVPLTYIVLDPSFKKALFSSHHHHVQTSHHSYLALSSVVVHTEFTPEETCWHSEVFCHTLDKKRCVCFGTFLVLLVHPVPPIPLCQCYMFPNTQITVVLSLNVPPTSLPQVCRRFGPARQHRLKILYRIPLCCCSVLI